MATCSDYNFELKKPCSCERCSKHINCPDSFNCLNHYLLKHGNYIPPKEASELLNIKPNDFKKAVEKAINESRVSKLDSVIGRGNEFEYIPDSDICVVCNKPVLKKGIYVNNIVYCSKACRNTLPPAIALLMNRLGIDERTLLYALVQCFSGYRICELLNLTESELKRWVNRLTGIKIKTITDTAPQPYEPYLDKPIKTPKCRLKSFIYNNDSVFKDVDDFCSI